MANYWQLLLSDSHVYGAVLMTTPVSPPQRPSHSLLLLPPSPMLPLPCHVCLSVCRPSAVMDEATRAAQERELAEAAAMPLPADDDDDL